MIGRSCPMKDAILIPIGPLEPHSRKPHCHSAVLRAVTQLRLPWKVYMWMTASETQPMLHRYFGVNVIERT